MASRTERKGVNHCGEIAEDHNWMFREQPINDVGIDAHIEFTDKAGRSRQLLALQIKTGPSYFKELKDGCYLFRKMNERQYNYWTTNSLPCILVLYNPKDKMCIWQKLTSKTIERTKNGARKGFVVKVPISQVFLDDKSDKMLREFSNLPDHITNYNFLLSQKQFMHIIQNGGSVKLHSQEWVNKSIGRGDTELIVDDGTETKTYSYPYWFPHTCYTEVFPRLFPWADFTADPDFYYDEDLEKWHQLHCHYDRDEGWIVVGDSFADFRAKLDPMRSVDHSGEVAEYMLELSLNELGESFLCLDEYLSKERPYTGARPEKE